MWSYKSQCVKSGTNDVHKLTYPHCFMLNNTLKKYDILCLGNTIRPHPQHEK